MAKITGIQLYHSTTPGVVPLAADLLPGELAPNIADEVFYFKNAAGDVVSLSGGGVEYVIKTTTYTAVSGDQIMANTSTAAWTLTLPATPAVNDYVDIADYAGTFATNNLTVARNGVNIMGLAENLLMDTNNAAVRFTYVDVTQGWRIV